MASLRAAASATTWSFFLKIYDFQFLNQKGKTLPVQDIVCFFWLHWISIEYLYTVWVNTHYKCTLEMCILTYKIQFNDFSGALEIMLLTSSITLY